MKNTLKQRLKISLLALLAGSFFAASNASSGDCTVITANSNQYYRVSGALHHHTLITLPEPLKRNPYVGNKDLWTVFAEVGSRQVAFGPNSKLENGESTTLSLVTESDTYFFQLYRVPEFTEACVHVVKEGNPFAPTTSLLVGSPDSSSLSDEVLSASSKIDERVASALSKYQSTIYSSYSFRENGKPPSKLISVWDDGRFTYVRFDSARFGVPTFHANKKDIVRVEPDDNNNSYRIAGVHKQLTAQFANGAGYSISRK